MTGHAGPLPAGDERHLKALEAAHWTLGGGTICHYDEDLPGYVPIAQVENVLAAYHRSLADQGVRLVDASEVAEWLRGHTTWEGKQDRISVAYADAFLARFGGGDER